MTYEEYLTRCLTRRECSPSERLGQAYFNVLADVRPELADRVRGSHWLDPFYKDELVPDFLTWAASNW